MDKLLQSRCRNLLKEYEDLLVDLQEQEKKRLQDTEYSGDSAFKIAKQAIFNQGIIEGQKRTIQKLNELAK